LNYLYFNRDFGLLDIGARDGIGWPWKDLDQKFMQVSLVEPDPEEFKRLSINNKDNLIPFALWSDNKKLTLNINNSEGTSSIYDSNFDFLGNFPEHNRFQLKNQVTVDAKTIDFLHKKNHLKYIDFLKIDVQGGELEILKGGTKLLKEQLVGMELEVEFSQMYKNQPLFGDVHNFITGEIGLELWDLRKTYWKFTNHTKMPHKGKLVFGDALYLRPIEKLPNWLESMSRDIAEDKLHKLFLTCFSYGYIDYVLMAISQPGIEKFLTDDQKIFYRKSLKKYTKSFYPFRNGNVFLYRLFKALMNSFMPTHNGWAYAESNLGSKKKNGFWI